MTKFGPTGEFPEGKLNKDDEGALVIGITYDQKDNLVIIDFGSPVKWFGMRPTQAVEFANTILRRVQERK